MKLWNRQKNIIPGFYGTVGVTIMMLAVFILIPLASILMYCMKQSPGEFVEELMRDEVRWAIFTSLWTSLAAAAVNCVFGVLLAWVLVRFEFPGKEILDALIELPFALPTAVCGITLSKLYSDTGFMGRLGACFSYTHVGIIIALIFVGLPFVVRSVQPVLMGMNPACEEAAQTLGASRRQTFFRVILPELMPALIMGFGQAFARGMGEYGSVIYIAGNSVKDHTQVSSYIIMQKLNYMDYASASTIAFVMLMISFLILLLINIVQIRAAGRTKGMEVATVGDDRAMGADRKRSGSEMVLIIASILFVGVMLVMPLVSVITNAFAKGPGFVISAITDEYVISALMVTIGATVIAVIVNSFFGIVAGIALTKYKFPGRQLLTTLIDIPFSVSPVIAGLAYLMTFGRLGWFAPILEWINDTFGTDIQIVFAFPGVVLATIFVTFPFVSREVIPVLNAAGTDEEEAAAVLGAKGWTIFRKITFPQAKRAFFYGVILCTARAMGEFGAVAALSKTRGQTFTLPLEIDALYLSGDEDSVTAAFAVSLVLVMLAMCTLVIRKWMEKKEKQNKKEK